MRDPNSKAYRVWASLIQINPRMDGEALIWWTCIICKHFGVSYTEEQVRTIVNDTRGDT